MRDRRLLFYQLPETEVGSHLILFITQEKRGIKIAILDILVLGEFYFVAKKFPLLLQPSLGKGKPRSPTDKHGFLL